MSEEIEKKFIQILSRLGNLEQRMIDMIHPLQSLRSDHFLEKVTTLINQPLAIDDRPVRKAFNDLEDKLKQFEEIIIKADFKHFQSFMDAIKETNLQEVYAMLKYQANRIKEIEKILLSLSKNQETGSKIEVFVNGEKQSKDEDIRHAASVDRILDFLEEKELIIFKAKNGLIEGIRTHREIEKCFKIPNHKISPLYQKILLKIERESLINLKVTVEKIKECLPKDFQHKFYNCMRHCKLRR